MFPCMFGIGAGAFMDPIGWEPATGMSDQQSVLNLGIFQYAARDETPAKRLERLDTALAGHAEPLDAVVCPEMFLSGYGENAPFTALAEPAGGPSAETLAKVAEKHGVALIAGYTERDGDKLRNAALCVGPDGGTLMNYRKRNIAPGFERDHFRAGHGEGLLTLAGVPAAVLICYDVEFPEEVRRAALAGAQVVFVPTALTDEWVVVSRKMIPTRAFENGVFIAYANYAGSAFGLDYLGESRIVGPDGRNLACAGAQEALISACIDLTRIPLVRSRLPYISDLTGS